MAPVVTAAALSEHPLATHAVGECVGQLLEAGGPGPDLVAIFVDGAAHAARWRTSCGRPGSSWNHGR